MARRRPLFLGQSTYRARRLGDAARLLPALGVILFLLPLLIRPADSSTAFLYVFGIWGLLIVVVALLSPRLAQVLISDEAGSEPVEETPPAAADDGGRGG